MSLLFFTGTQKECADKVLANVQSLNSKAEDIMADTLMFSVTDDCTARVLREGPPIAELFESFFLLSVREKYECILQSIKDMYAGGYLPKDYTVPFVLSLFGVSASGYSNDTLKQNVMDLLNEFQLPLTPTALQEKLIDDLKLENILPTTYVFDKENLSGTNENFFLRYAFLNMLYLNRGLVYYASRTLPELSNAKGEIYPKDTASLVTANPEILKGLYAKGLLLGGKGELLTDETFNKFLTGLTPKTGKTLNEHFSENKRGVAKLTLIRLEGGLHRFTITKTLVPLAIKTVDEAKYGADKKGNYTTTLLSSLSSLYAYGEFLKETYPQSYFRYTKQTAFGRKTGIIAIGKDTIMNLYSKHPDSIDKVNYMERLQNVRTGFSISNLRYEFYNAQASMSGKAISTFTPIGIEKLEMVTEQEINRSLHILNPTVLKDYVVVCINKAKSETLKPMFSILPNTTATGAAMNLSDYKSALKNYLTGWTANGNNANIKNTMPYADLWEIVTNPSYSALFGTVDADSLTTEAMPKWKKEFTAVDIPEAPTVEARAKVVNSLIQQYAPTHAMRITYKKSDGTISTSLLSKNYTALKKVYHSNWLGVVSESKKLAYAKSRATKFNTGDVLLSLKFLLSSLYLDDCLSKFGDTQSKQLKSAVESIIELNMTKVSFANSVEFTTLSTVLEVWYKTHTLLNSLGVYDNTSNLAALLNLDNYDGSETLDEELQAELKRMFAPYITSNFPFVQGAELLTLFTYVLTEILNTSSAHDSEIDVKRNEAIDFATYNVNLFLLENYKGHSTQSLKPTNVISFEVSKIEDTATSFEELADAFLEKTYQLTLEKAKKKKDLGKKSVG